jgi:hypothetical protein
VVGREREWTEDPAKAQRVRAALEACIRKKGSDVSIAKLFQTMFPGVYKWCGENKSTIPYFRFNGTYWQQHKSTAGVMTLLSDVLAPEFEAEATKSFLEAKEKEESDKEKAKADEARGHRAAKVALDLENNSHRESAVKEIANLYHEEGFSGKLDAAEDLLCFENGVYDLSTGQFRPGVPEDKLSVSTGYDYVAEGGGHRAAVDEYFRRVYPDDETRDYMLRSYAQMLNGRMMKRVFVHTGPFGDNGKSTTFEFLKVIFGRYGKTMPIKYLTSVRPDAGKADSVLMGLKGVRFAAMEEPDNNAYINGALACELTGGSKISGRDLFCANVEYRPQFVPHLACNKLPSIDNDNGGARNRVRKCDYVSRFVLGGEVDEDSHVYPADPQINLRFSEWAMDAMLLLLSMYEHVYVEHCPASIQQSTEDYMDDGNVMALFAKMYIKRATKDDHFKLKDAEMKWSSFVTAVERQAIDVKFRDLTKPSKEGFRQGLQTVLKTACPKDPRPIGGKNHKSAFRGWVLLEDAVELNE